MSSKKNAEEKHTGTSKSVAGASVLAMAAALAAAPAFAQTQTTDTDTDDEIVVTGSILRGNANSVNPLGVTTAEDMEVRGQTTIAETLDTLAGNAGGSSPNAWTAGGGFASGAAFVSLRGLLSSNTLTLADGLRLPYYALADDAIRNFVDLNTIPQNIVERVEVLKDGASSTYGADAIAGVINVITRREFNGFNVDVSTGRRQSGDGAEQERISAIWGHGDLSEDGYNFYIASEYQHDNLFFNRDADFFPNTTADLSSLCATSIVDNVTQTCGASGVFWGLQHDGSFTAPTARNYGSNTAMIRRRNAANTGFDAADNYQLLSPTCNPHSNPGVITPAAAAVKGVPGFNVPVNVCTQDNVREYGLNSSEFTRASLSARMSFELDGGAEAYLMGNYYQNEVFTPGTPQNIRNRTTPSTTGVIVRTDTNATPANLPVWVCPQGSLNHLCDGSEVGAVLNPQNPFAAQGRDAGIWYSFGDIPTSTLDFSQVLRAAGGISGEIEMQGHVYRYDITATGAQNNLIRRTEGILYYPNLIATLRRGTYNFVNPALNTEQVRDFLAPDLVQRSQTKVVQLQATVSTDLFELPGGMAEGGLSLQGRYEALDNPSQNSDRLGAENRYFTINPFGASGSRDTESIAFEVNLPLMEMLDVNVSGRYDTYSTGQSNFSPKAGFRFEPFDFLAFRGAYSQGFRIPSFAESFADPSTGFVTVSAPAAWCLANHGSVNDPYCVSYGLGQTTIASPNLQPETSENINVGFVVQPFDDWSFSADYYKITQEGVIGPQATAAAIVAYYAGNPIPAGINVIPDVPNPNNPGGARRIAFVQSGLANLGQRDTHGWDFQVSGSHDFGGVNWSTSAEATWLQSLSQAFPGQSPPVQEYAGTIGPYIITAASGTPKWRANWQNTFTSGPLSVGVTAYWTEGYKLVAEDIGGGGTHNDPDCNNSTGVTVTYFDGVTPIVCRVDDSFYVDLHTSYDFTEQFQLYLDVSNVLGEDPAWDPTTYGAVGYNPAWGWSGIVGRYFTLGARLKL